MIKRILIMACLLAISSLVIAQENQMLKFGFGPRIGLGFNTLSEEIDGKSVQVYYNEIFVDSDISATEFNIGFFSGAFANVLVANRIGLQVEMLFSGEGTGIRFTNKTSNESYNDGNNDYVSRYRMLNIPVLLQVHIKNNIKAYGGIQISTLREITALVGTRSPSNKPQTVPESTWSSSIHSNWVGGAFGASVEAEGFILDARITFGPEIGKTPSLISQNPFSFQLGVGYNIISLFDKKEVSGE